MQFRVPQNIAMEDRIAGPLSGIQFAILVIGGMLSFLVFTSTSLPSPINQLIGGVMGLVTVLMSVGKFNDQPMYRFFRFIIAFVISPKTRVWQKKNGAEPTLIKQTAQKSNATARPVAKKVTKDQLAALAAVLDSRGQQGIVPKPEEKKR